MRRLITTMLLIAGALLALPSCQTMDSPPVPNNNGATIDVKTRASYKRNVLKSETPVVVNFSSEVCSFCSAMDAVTQVVAKRHRGKVRVVNMSMEDHWGLADRLNIETAPTTMIFANGRRVWTKPGLVPTHEIEKNLAPYMKAAVSGVAMASVEE